MSQAGTAQRVLVVLLVAALLLSALVVKPFFWALFLAAVFAGALKPGMERLTRSLRGRRQLAGALLSVSFLVAVVLPLTVLGATLVKQAADGVAWVRELLQSEGIAGLVAYLPDSIERHATDLLRRVPRTERQLSNVAASHGGDAAAAVGGILSWTGNFLVQAAMMLIGLYFFLVDGPRLIGWLNEVVPLKRGQLPELLEDFRKVSVAVLFSTVATAGVQALVALAGYLIAQVPNAFFFTVVTFFIAMIPAVGAASVVLVMALFKLAMGNVLAAVFLAVWGVVVVGLVDNVVKPLIIRGGLEIHGAVIFFALLGGLSVFGAVGLIAGPLSIAFLVAVVRMYHRDFGNGGAP
jgi:predicted PurR-regulated permease PerM